MHSQAWIVALGMAVVAGGCGCNGGGPGVANRGPSSAVAGDGIGERKAKDLPAVGDHLAPLDDGRLEVAPPEGWTVLPRATSSLVTFVRQRGQSFPRITINAQQPPADLADDLTKENVDRFLAWQDRHLREKRAALWEGVLPLVMEETLFVRHVRRAEDGSGTPLVVQSLQTVQGGRHYTVELIVQIDAPRAEDYEQSLTEWRNHAYAVAASMRFAAEGERFDPLAGIEATPAEEPSAEEPSAAEPPAEEPQPLNPPNEASPADEAP